MQRMLMTTLAVVLSFGFVDVANAHWFRDADGDGFGNPYEYVLQDSVPPPGYVADYSDCDDTDVNVYPGAPERCNGIDDDCNGFIDDNVVSVLWYPDGDGDGYGDMNVSGHFTCSPPPGYVPNNTDCNDSNLDVNPGASESCNGIDDNCSGDADEGCVLSADPPLGPVTLVLYPPAPNPFVSATSIAFDLPAGSKTVNVRVLDSAGRLVRTLVDTPMPAGRHRVSWDGRNASGTPAPTGMYYVMIENAGAIRLGKLIRIR